MDQTLYISPIVGFRYWDVCLDVKNQPYLSSCMINIKWPYKKALASSFYYNYTQIVNHGIGIYAYKQHLLHGTYGLVGGEVYLWGSVSEHEYGYRAEFAYPKNLTDYVCFRCSVNIQDGVFLRKSNIDKILYYYCPICIYIMEFKILKEHIKASFIDFKDISKALNELYF